MINLSLLEQEKDMINNATMGRGYHDKMNPPSYTKYDSEDYPRRKRSRENSITPAW